MFLRVNARHDYFQRLVGRTIIEAQANRPLEETGPRLSVVVLPFIAGQYRVQVWNDLGEPDSDPDIVVEM